LTSPSLRQQYCHGNHPAATTGYDFISEFVQRNGYSPSFEEMARALELSSLATVHKHISQPGEKGLLTRRLQSQPLQRPVAFPKATQAGYGGQYKMVLPLVGRIAARPADRACQSNETISLPLRAPKEVFVLEVRGDSMQDEAILNGDYVMVEKSGRRTTEHCRRPGGRPPTAHSNALP